MTALGTLLALWATPVGAQQTGLSTGPVGPWTKGVSPEDQTAADALFAEGNGLLKNSGFAQAAAAYREALEHWDHPAIHYNLALAVLNLDRLIEVHEHMTAAIRYGAAPLDAATFKHAQHYLTMAERQLARVKFTCDEPGALVQMDGQTLFVAPGSYEGLVRPGPHTLIATREGFVPTDLSRPIFAGQKVTLHFQLHEIDELRRWPAWKPWAVLSTGAVVAAGGGLFYMRARENYRAFDEGIANCGGCVPEPSLALKRTQGARLHKLALGTWAAGGAVLTTGVVMVLLNRPQLQHFKPSQGQTVTLAPMFGGAGTRGVVATLQFGGTP